MSRTFRLPDLGEGVREAEILAVHVTVGQVIREGDLLLEVETDKAAVEIPSPFSGTVQEIRVRKGDMAKVGAILISFADSATAAASGPAAKPATVAPPAETPGHSAAVPGSPVPASPATRRLARELGVDLRALTPSGAGGVVTRDDVLAFAEGTGKPETPPPAPQPSPPASEPAPPPEATVEITPPTLPDFSQWGPVSREPFHSIRRATAVRMTTSWTRIPHVTCQDAVDITRLEAFRRQHKGEIEQGGGRLTMTIFALKAAATALKRFPHFNASLDPTAGEIIVKHYYHIGIAVDTEHGLMVPVIRDVDRKSIRELAVELQGAVDRARERRTSREEMVGGTFTITNVGGLGGSYFTAIINHPEIAILGLGQGRLQPVVVTSAEGEHDIVPRLMMPIILCFDHRVVDGADAVRFLRRIIELLEDPDELFLTMI
ncbi:2-oxo acid dehydrogenase subunit E2 [Desulfoprunum benzoelyticum]|uniref:Dihydrolipoamide acetyltransferase component of pyruvate dehydrogenase complex n=1 Tax=Desulfoprunum benzoelyticum TaxID=1506996 RepID=A0A840UR15_9BACT|nr:dihydrolipoamide acetyltransferase family protein [Desulfoprunum benzoelyticum]MBB5348232.1 pyruvate dehydrogenase E2 component (dihydrolipoamide acetyltransferase) [Desulfoprunum benzoelyticum]MBM9529576.1 2-oxo acid dehydrogenase subunit E2 [Desulfoprunum benzoelyticum]